MRTISGKCHCGNIAYRLEWPEAGKAIAVRACGCTFCTKHGGVYTSHPGAALSARVGDENLVNKYAFGTKTAEFYVCVRCGASGLRPSGTSSTSISKLHVQKLASNE